MAALLGVSALAASCTGHQNRRLRRFEQTLAANDSATAALRQWCAAEHIADPARIVAQPVRDATAPEPPRLRETLRIGAEDRVGYRHVRLVCGALVLSEAHNWYVPGRLTAEMNAVLESSDTPFGTVAAPLGFRRERLSVTHGAGADCPAGTVLSHRALLRLPDGSPLALVVECYTRASVG